jgi:hypothetical protein
LFVADNLSEVTEAQYSAYFIDIKGKAEEFWGGQRKNCLPFLFQEMERNTQKLQQNILSAGGNGAATSNCDYAKFSIDIVHKKQYNKLLLLGNSKLQGRLMARNFYWACETGAGNPVADD